MQALQLKNILLRQLGEQVLCATTSLQNSSGKLFAEEQLLIQRAVPERMREFTAGRHLSHKLLEELGLESMPILRNGDRAPIYPHGVTASITHSGDLCAVVMAFQKYTRALGIDIEASEPLKEELWPSIMTERELLQLAQLSEASPGLWAKTIFSAKEAFYKAQYQVTETFLNFWDVELSFGVEEGYFEVEVLHEAAGMLAGFDLRGQFFQAEDYVCTSLRL